MDESYPYRTLSVKTALSPDKPSKNPDLSVKKPHFTDKPSGIPDLSVNTYHSPDKSPESPDLSVEARRFPDKRVSALAAGPAERRMIGRRPAAHRSALVTFSANIALFPDNPSRNSDLSATPPAFHGQTFLPRHFVRKNAHSPDKTLKNHGLSVKPPHFTDKLTSLRRPGGQREEGVDIISAEVEHAANLLIGGTEIAAKASGKIQFLGLRQIPKPVSPIIRCENPGHLREHFCVRKEFTVI